MKVSSTSSTSSAAPTSGSGAASGATGFRDLLSGAAPTAGAGGSPTVGSAASVSAVSALFALQGLGPSNPEARNLALRKGRRLLAALDRLQADLLGRGASMMNLRELQSALAEDREASGDADLDATLGWAEVRVAVEAAKLEAAAERA